MDTSNSRSLELSIPEKEGLSLSQGPYVQSEDFVNKREGEGLEKHLRSPLDGLMPPLPYRPLGEQGYVSLV